MPEPGSKPASNDPFGPLALRAAAGDEAAFAALRAGLSTGLQRHLAAKLGSQPHDIEELTQQVWITLWRSLRAGRFDPQRARLSTFLYAIANNFLLRELRRRGRRSPGAAADDDLARLEDPRNPVEDVALVERIEIVRALLHDTTHPDALTAEERTVLIGLTNGDTERGLSASLGLAASTVHARKLSGFEKLRRALARAGYGPDASERPAESGE